MDDRYRGHSVIVTGSASGIGEACALWFHKRGARVYGADSDPQPRSEATYRDLGITSLRCDVRDAAEVQSVVDRVIQETGRLDVLVYSAGVEVAGAIPDIDEADWDRCLDTNFKGAFLFAKAVIPKMAAGEGGVIVTVASNAGLLTRWADPVYSISKAALIALTKALALGHAKDRVRVNALCPGPVVGTRMMDKTLSTGEDPARREQEVIAASPMALALGRMASTEEMANAVGYLADPNAPFVTGAILAIDGGKSLGVPPNFRAMLSE